MKAVVFEEPNRFAVKDVEMPRPDAGWALIKVKATTICATDQKILAGKFAGVTFPRIPGHEWSGEVVEVGPGVDGFKPGDRVGVEVHVGCGRCRPCLEGLYNLCKNYGNVAKGHAHIGFTVNGGLAEYCAVPARALHKLPEELSFDQGAFTDNIGIALYAVERGGLRPGEGVVVVGPGAFGLLAVQVAKAMGAAKVLLTGTREDRLKLGFRLGADVVVNAKEHPDPLEEVKGHFGGEGPDLVVEFAGTAEAARQAIQIVRRGGRVVLAGSTGLGNELRIDLSLIVRGHLEILGALANPRRISERGLELIRRGKVRIDPLITHHFPLEEFPEAWQTFIERREGAIRVMMHP